MSEHVEKAKKYLAETGWPATREALDEELTRVVYLLAKVVDQVDIISAQLSEARTDDVVRDAERYRAVRDNLGYMAFTDSDHVLLGVFVSKPYGSPYYGDKSTDLNAAADGLLAAQQHKAD